MKMPEPLDDSPSEELAEIAKAVAGHTNLDDAFEAMIDAARKMPEQLQRMVDTIVAMQEEWPMPEEGWRNFVEGVARTNERLGINLRIELDGK
jgi:hypothetical protein